MEVIIFNPLKATKAYIGYQYDHNAYKIVFELEGEEEYYLKLQTGTKTYQTIPLPNKEFPITSTYTDKARTFTGQIFKKVNGELIKHSPIFYLTLKESLPPSDLVKEEVPPNFQTAYDDMVAITKEIEDKLANGEFDGKDGLGIKSIVKTGTQGLIDTYTITFTDESTTTYQVTNGKNGQDGQDGITPNIQIGTVTTLEPNEQATVKRTGTNENPVFNFGIPRGQDGKNATIDEEMLLKLAIKSSTEGNPAIATDTAEWKNQGIEIYGQTTQDGTPTPTDPKEMISKEISKIILRTPNLSNLKRDAQTSGNPPEMITTIENDSITIDKQIAGQFTQIFKLPTELLVIGRTYEVTLYSNGKKIGVNDGVYKVFFRTNFESTITITKDILANINIGKYYIQTMGGSIESTLGKRTYQIIVCEKGFAPENFVSANQQVVQLSQPITLRGIPVTSGGNVVIDGKQYMADYIDSKTGKINRLNGYIDSYNGEDVGTVFMSTTGQLTTGAKVIYKLSQPTQEDLPQQDQEAIRALTTYYPTTVLDTGAWSKLNYVADPKNYIDNKLSAINNAILESRGK